MMMNLFSSFNPSMLPLMNLNWLSSMIFIILYPMKYWLINSQMNIIFNLLTNLFLKEMNLILKNTKNLFNSLLLTSLFMFIFLNNISSLYPYIFPSPSHLVFSMTFSISLFMIYMLYGWIKNFDFMCTHLVPSNSPNILIPFMIIIETISNLIRPLTLSIRLSANIIAGHMLINLICINLMNSSMMLMSMLFLAQLLLLFLELNVSLIQSYVFSILSTLYSKETNYE